MPGTTIIIISPPPPPTKPKSTRLTTVRQHLENVLSGDMSYTVIERATNWKDRVKALKSSWVARFHGAMVLLSSAMLMIPDLLMSVQASLSLLNPAIDARSLAYAAFALGIITPILRARTAFKAS